MTRYIITRYRRRDGVNLSRPGKWGNVPFATDDEAVAYAKADAGSGRPTIERESA